MRVSMLVLVVATLPLTAAAAVKPCEELKAEIQARLDAKGVKGASLEVVAKDDTATPGAVVGSCEGGTKKIVYSRK